MHTPADSSDGVHDEAALIRAAQADPRAFGQLYRRYLPQLYRYLRSRLPSDDDAADLAQQVFLQALEALPSYRPTSVPFAAWLFRIARNALIDTARRRHPTIPWENVPEAHQPAAPHNIADDHAAFAHFAALIAPLEESEQELLTLRFVVGLRTKEIAAVVGRTDGAIRMQLTRSLRSLKESLNVHQ